MKQFTKVVDSGERREFGTGSVRDKADGKGRFSLIPYMPLKRLAIHFENGSKKYEERNWEKGQPLSTYYDSATRHINELFLGNTDEDHGAAAIWNLFAYLQTEAWIEDGILPKELDDRPIYLKK